LSEGGSGLIIDVVVEQGNPADSMGASFNVYIVAFAQLPAVYAQAAMA
jgi:hypothetical protein